MLYVVTDELYKPSIYRLSRGKKSFTCPKIGLTLSLDWV